MNKEIKFRAWNGDELIYEGGKQFMYYRHSYDILQSYETVMQFIGIKDQNNIEIYEDDIVDGRYMIQRSLDPDSEPEIITFKGIIKYSEGCYYVKDKNDMCVFSFSYQDYELDVIGNIHENPELINN